MDRLGAHPPQSPPRQAALPLLQGLGWWKAHFPDSFAARASDVTLDLTVRRPGPRCGRSKWDGVGYLRVDPAAAGTESREVMYFSAAFQHVGTPSWGKDHPFCPVVVFQNILWSPTWNPLLQPFQWLCKPLIPFLLKLAGGVSISSNPTWLVLTNTLTEPFKTQDKKV